MLRTAAILICTAAVASAGLSGCAPVIRTQGYMVLDANPRDAVVGEDGKLAVESKYGTPTAVSTFDENIWYYMAQATDQFGAYRPTVRQRYIVAIRFDEDTQTVASVEEFDVNDGRQIAFSSRETPTIGRELGVLEQLLGTLGQTFLPPPEDDPGQLPGQGGL